MTSQSIPGEALNASDPSSYITEKNSRREQPNDVTCRPVFNPATRCGAYFLPMEMPSRDPVIKSLPHTPLELFQIFLPYSLVKTWVQYTNRWIESLLQDRHLKPAARLKSWVETSVAEVYIWLAILIYIGIHKEATIHSHWETSHPEHYAPDHPIRRLMTYDRFQLLQRHIRVFNPFNISDIHLPRVFQAVDNWSEHIQRVSLDLWTPGTNLAVDECMTRFTGRSYETTKVPNKPTPLGFKSWVAAQKGFFLQWIWHQPKKRYGPVALVKKKDPIQLSRQLRSQRRRGLYTPLNPTQSVVVALVNKLPKARYHVFIDNLFSSANLFTHLRRLGHGATGTARRNCGIYKPFVQLKVDDTAGRNLLRFGEVRKAPTVDHKVNQIAWKDNSLVLFLTSVFKGDELVKRKRKRPNTMEARARPIQRFFGDEAVKDFNIPLVAAIYNDEMNHVDRGDQLRASLGYNHRIRRGPWQALAWTFLLEIALVNSYLLQLHGNPSWKRYKSQTAWRSCIVDALIAAFSPDYKGRKLYRSGHDNLSHPGHQLIYRGRTKNSRCHARPGHRCGVARSQAQERALAEINGNRGRKEAPKSRWEKKYLSFAAF
ncbi:hypothetical protein BFJ66_g15994 [Fusarium oxysporum f. sp. cepae]|nr:hypothetical protein BFJ66_g15994 [Fusarium oxysporum f. sp. cepae]